MGYCSHILLFAGFQLQKVVVFDLVDEVRYHLYHTVPGRWIGRGAPSAYPLRSPDKLIEFFTDGAYVNNFVCQVKMKDFQQSKARISAGVFTVTHTTLKHMD